MTEKTLTMTIADQKPEVFKNAVPPEMWGVDHWQTFAYLANRITNQDGVVSLPQMRCDANIHPQFAWYSPMGAICRGEQYPTRLKDGTDRTEHDDWSCIEDFVAAGCVEWNGTGINPVFAFTDEGWRVWNIFNRHIAEHKAWSRTFVYPWG